MAELVWSPRSLKDLEIIHSYISQDSEVNARSFIRHLINEGLKIVEFPLAGRIVPEMMDNRTREKIFKSYRLIYRVTQDGNVEIITILHQAKRSYIQEK